MVANIKYFYGFRNTKVEFKVLEEGRIYPDLGNLSYAGISAYFYLFV